MTQNGAQNGAPFFSQNGAERRTAQKGAERRASLEETLCGGRNLDKLIRLSKY